MLISFPAHKEQPMTADSSEVVRPCMLVAHGDLPYAESLSRAFRRLGWDVYQARSGPEARRLARMLEPELLVLATDLAEESGWLTCEKVLADMPGVKVFLVGPDEGNNREYAAFVGATLIDSRNSIAALVQEVGGHDLPAAG
jgi:hypothetical protein